MSRRAGTPLEHEKHVTENGYGSSTIKYVEHRDGFVMLEICDECSCVMAFCEHEQNKWNDDGIVLTCMLCGLDGT